VLSVRDAPEDGLLLGAGADESFDHCPARVGVSDAWPAGHLLLPARPLSTTKHDRQQFASGGATAQIDSELQRVNSTSQHYPGSTRKNQKPR
jgi:hypothetical protein